MLVRGREGVERFGLLDFQDALAGHPAYDLASVLEDARRDVPEDIERAMIERYVAATGHGDAFERAYWALAAQRNTRILGVFTRLWKRDNKPHYRACGGFLNETSSSRSCNRLKIGSTQILRRCIAAIHGWTRCDSNAPSPTPSRRSPGRGPAHRDDHGCRPGQTHAAANDDPPEASH